MYGNEYTNPAKALEMIRTHGSLTLGNQFYYPSLNEIEAYKTLASDLTLYQDDLFLHKPSKKLILLPKVGMGVTLHYPNDCYPYEIIKVVSLTTLVIREMNYTPVPGWTPNFQPGGFHGHISNLRDRKFTYSSNPNGMITRIRLNKKGHWMNKSIPYSIGEAKYFLDWNN